MIAGETRAVRIARRRAEALDIAGFDLVSDDGRPLPAFTAGAHVDVQTPDGPVRSYSLCNPPGPGSHCDHYRIAVLREPASRGGSAAMHDRLQEGDRLTIGLPRNLFALQPAARTLLLAGGIGITPLLAMAHALAAAGADFTLHYATRSAARTAFADELRAAGFADRVHLHHDDGDPSQRFDAAAVLGRPDPEARVYVCGPTGFIDWVWQAAAAVGWPADRLHREYFTAAPAGADGDGGFTVRIASTGQEVPVAADQSVVAALLAHGVDVLVSCEQGICGTCLTRVLEGEPDHRDQYLTDDEKAANDQFTPCCSRARTPLLVLDL